MTPRRRETRYIKAERDISLIIVSLLPGFSTRESKMKGLVCCAVLILMCALVQVQGGCEFEGEPLSVGVHYRKCLKITCHSETSMSAVACPQMRCKPGEQIGYHELNVDEPYPQCCARPICKSEK